MFTRKAPCQPTGVAGGGSAGSAGCASFLAWATTRSTADLLPFLVGGAGESRLRSWLARLARLNLLLPATYLCGAHPVAIPITSLLARH